VLALDEYGPERAPAHDPFRVLVEKPRKVDPMPYPSPQPEPVKQVPLPPPLTLTVNAIAGEDTSYVAVITYQGQDHIVEPGWESRDRKFIVKTVSSDKVEVFSTVTKALQIFPF